MKRFNSTLYGASYGVTSVLNPTSPGLNFAKTGATSADLTQQVATLVGQIMTNSSYDFNADWKLITIFVGANDLCQYSPEGNVRLANA